MMEEMNAMHDFMAKFSREIEVIWGTAIENDLEEDVKVTLLATGFSITSIPGIMEKRVAETKAEESKLKLLSKLLFILSFNLSKNEK